jgi:adenylyl-sulfate kinase
MTNEDQNIHPDDRAHLMGQRPHVIWFTGLSGAGKSTLANLLDQRLHAQGIHSFVLDGDLLRMGLNRGLGYSDADRSENIRRAAEVARLMADAGLVVLVAFISPFRRDRDAARALFGAGQFSEVFLDTPLAVAEQRDPKGLYARARRGEIPQFTGIDSPYEAPGAAELRIDTATCTVDDALELLMQHIRLQVGRP